MIHFAPRSLYQVPLCFDSHACGVGLLASAIFQMLRFESEAEFSFAGEPGPSVRSLNTTVCEVPSRKSEVEVEDPL